MSDLLNMVRQGCRYVCERATSVRIVTSVIPQYAAALCKERLSLPTMDPAIHYLGHGADTVAFFLTLNTINFGSGYFPDILGDPCRSGYRVVASALNRHFEAEGPFRAAALRRLTPANCSQIFFPGVDNEAATELMELFARALNDLGTLVEEKFGGDVTALVAAAENSAERLVELLDGMPLFHDAVAYGGIEVPFFKRAQLAAVDLHIAFGGGGPGRFDDLDRLTACADNLVPHVLRLDGILEYRPELLARIQAGAPIPAGSPEEAEIRAAAVHACELIVEELRGQGVAADAMRLDNLLWHRGQEPRYRAHPRHRSRTAFY
ncbi:queuosine salvage family protein [Geomesophilobacter sediminis]|uniref:Queuosine 5'-phosphate N-glycosylase/hydrolase n=1 Tax=Geomesophilobacter sediminis TaxID=2798584 RepID=A0A8J7IXN4_9BACT|nr:queuosine salvage family protein [Geomesophilobacter sediminis]MBJ6724712.1 hypothetical protein [Geomesophilobacter sediminis]